MSERFKNRSPGGTYRDLVEELDWSVGEILATLERLGLDDRTMVFIASDNGATLFGYPAIGLSGFLTAAVLGIWLVIGIMRSGRL